MGVVPFVELRVTQQSPYEVIYVTPVSNHAVGVQRRPGHRPRAADRSPGAGSASPPSTSALKGVASGHSRQRLRCASSARRCRSGGVSMMFRSPQRTLQRPRGTEALHGQRLVHPPGWTPPRRGGRAPATRGRLSTRAARSAESRFHASRNVLPTEACSRSGRWPMTFLHSWTWQRRTTPREPKTSVMARRQPSRRR